VGKGTYSGIAHAGLSAVYTASNTLADVSGLLSDYSWVNPTEKLLVTQRNYEATYNADPDNYNDFPLNITVKVSKGTYSGIAHADLSAVYTASNTLADLSGLSLNYSWVTPTEKLTVAQSTYAAIYNADPDNYNDFPLSITVNVGKATPSYTAPIGLTAAYGQTLANVTLPAGFAWELAPATSVGNVGNNPFMVKFTPADEANYHEVSGIAVTVTVANFAYPPDAEVDPGTGTVTLPSGGGVTLPGDDGLMGTEDDIEVTVPGGSTIDPGTGEITIPGGGGEVTLPGGETVTVPGGSTIDSGTGEITIPGGGEVTFSGDDGQMGTGDDITVTVPGGSTIDSGTGKITLPLGEDGVLFPASAALTYGQTLADAVFSGQSGVGTFAYTQGTTVPTVAQSGTAYEVAFTPTDAVHINPLAQNVPITVSKATPAYTLPVGLTATVIQSGTTTTLQTLADVSLPARWAWDEALSASVGEAGECRHFATFTPADTFNYKAVREELTISVESLLDFDTYATALWNNAFILNLAQFEADNYTAKLCRWYRDGELQDTGMSWTPNKSGRNELPGHSYYFEMDLTKQGSTSPLTLRSTLKVMDVGTGIATNNTAALSVYPNPTNGELTIDNEQWDAAGAGAARPVIEIYNVNGTLVETRRATSLQTTINIGHLPIGVYIVKMGNKVAKVVRK
jgi:hypothetical protein